MFNSAFFKFNAREKLRNCYLALFVGAAVCMVPAYLRVLLSRMLNLEMLEGQLIAQGVNILVQLFVSNIFLVGFMRLLTEVRPEEQSISKKCDYNLIFFGYKSDFKNILKVTFFRELKVLLWGLIAFIPAVLAIAAIMLFVPTESLNGLMTVSMNYYADQTMENLQLAELFVRQNFPYLTLCTLIFIVTTVAASIPVIYKSYEYSMIPMILADHPDMKSKQVFRRSKDIMDGFRWRYFFLQLSFIIYDIAAFMAMAFTGSALVYIIAVAAIMPYKNMTYLEFYRQRNSVVEYNIEKYGQNTAKGME